MCVADSSFETVGHLFSICLCVYGSGQGLVAGCCECGDEPSGSCATELVS
jgi:hypothetical protein